MRRLLFLTVVILTLILGLEIFFFKSQKSYPYQLQSSRPIAVVQDMLPPVSEKPMIDFDALHEVAERPLFIKGRKPVVEDKIEAAEIKEKNLKFPRVVLNAIIVIDDKKRAMFKDLKEKTSFSLLEQEQHEGWKLIKIDLAKVLFNNGTDDYELLLRDYPKPTKVVPKNKNIRNIFKQKRDKAQDREQKRSRKQMDNAARRRRQQQARASNKFARPAPTKTKKQAVGFGPAF